MPPKPAARLSTAATAALAQQQQQQAPPPPANPFTLPLAPLPTWTPVPPIPYLLTTTLPTFPVRKHAQSPPLTKPARLLLVTHSDGGRLIHDHAGYAEDQWCLPGHARYAGLMCQLGESLAQNLGIGGGSPGGGGNRVAAGDGGTWDVLVQLPLKYNAYYKSRAGAGAGTGEHLDLYIAGHDGGKFDSVKQFAIHLAWLAGGAGANGGGGGGGPGGGAGGQCECKVCAGERERGGATAAEQKGRRSRWAEHQGPVVEGVPVWV